MGVQLPIKYREFYDVPRVFIVRRDSRMIMFDCPFSEDLDEYPDRYRVFMLPELEIRDLDGTWSDLRQRAVAEIGMLPVSEVQFDQTRRKFIDSDAVDRLLSKASSKSLLAR